MSSLSRDHLIRGLRTLVERLSSNPNRPVTIHIVGSAAIRLAHFERDDTHDIDVRVSDFESIRQVVSDIAKENRWRDSWLNDEVTVFWPSIAAHIDWITIYSSKFVTIEIAPAELLLAMKLLAARPGRDAEDIANLMSIVGIHSIEEADSVIERFYPGDALSPRACELVENILRVGLPEIPLPPQIPSGLT